MKKLLFLFIPYFIFSSGFTQTADEYNNRGVDKSNLKDFKGAIADYTKAIEINPQHEWATYNRGLSKQNLKDYRGAIADFSSAIENKPNDVSAYFSRGGAKANIADYRGAIEDYTTVIEAITVEINLSIASSLSRDSAEHKMPVIIGPIADFKDDIKINPKYARAYFNRGKVKLILGEKDSGCLDLKKAKELGDVLARDAIKIFCM